MEVDDDDEVLEELDVLLAKGLYENLHVLQYPITHAKRTYSSDQRMVARVKPEHKKIELEVLLDVSSPNYDQSKGEQIALNVDGGGSGEGMTYENSVMDTQVLSSQCVPQLGKRFVAGVIQDGQVHITPVSQVMQLQPSFKYMDRAEMRAMQIAKMKVQAESGNSSQDEADDAKAVTVRFKGAETEAARAARERSYAAYEKRLYQEKWITANVHHKDDTYSDRERSCMLCNQSDSSSASNFTEMSLSAPDYLKTLIPQYIISDIDSDITPDNVLSLAKLKSLPLAEQLKSLMKNAKIIHFSHLLTLLPSSPDANSVVRSLQSFAVLVQGCWIVKSEVLYPPNTVSSVSGVPADIMCKDRDFILCLFTKNNYLIRRDVAKKVSISGDEVKLIFEQISKMKVGYGWHLRLQPDTRFVSQYPEVSERQSMVWSARYKQLAKQLNVDIDESPSTSSSIKISQKQKEKSKPLKVTKKSTEATKSSHSSRKGSHATTGFPTAKMENGINDVNHSSMVQTNESNEEPQVQINSNDYVPLQIVEPMDFQFSANESVKSFTQLLKDDSVHTVGMSILSNPIPFVNPQNVGIETSFINKADKVDHNLATANNHSFGSINMDNVNSTVALVADQMRQHIDVSMQIDSANIPVDNNNIAYNNDASNSSHNPH